jgi:hypothetical protein
MKNNLRFPPIHSLLLVTGLFFAMAAVRPALAQDEATIAKDSVQVTVKGEAPGGWNPAIDYRVNGPIASGSQLYVELGLPTNKHWLKFDCQTAETKTGAWWKTGCGRNLTDDKKGVNYLGLVDLSIRLRNEVQGTDTTLFSGKFKVGKAPICPAKGCSEAYYVDEDWRIPIGYVSFEDTRRRGEDAMLHVGFWYRGNPADIEAHLLYQGKDIAKYSKVGNVAKDWDPNKHQWGYANCEFIGVYATPPAAGRGQDPKFGVGNNPGDYEVKVLIASHLARSIKFTVDADGSFDNGIATANKLGSNKVIVPVQVIGSQTTTWDRTAWKTAAFYGNPLTGFTAP